jgi:U3 small nucleolar ribonucleoprotein component
VVVVEVIAQVTFQPADANVASVFIIQQQPVILLNNVQTHVLVNLAMLAPQQIQLVVVMEHIVRNEIVF